MCPDEAVNVKIIKKILRVNTTYLIPVDSLYEQNWHSPIIQNLNQPFITMTAKNLKDVVN